jgi:putative endonuclease
VVYYVYILASRAKRLYTGMTNNLESRVFQHKQGMPGSHSARYNIHRLVYMEEYAASGTPLLARSRSRTGDARSGWR